MTFIEWIRLIFTEHESIRYFIVFLAAAFGGELAMISMSFLVAQGLFSIVPFLSVSYVGTLSSDILWFSLGKTKMVGKLFTHRYTNKTISTINEAVYKISKGSDFIALLLANFMIASRIILIMYVSKRDLKFWKFLYYEAIALVFWILSVFSIGYFSGIGYELLSDTLDNVYAGIGFILLVIFVFVFIQLWFKKKFTEEIKENII